MPKNIVISCDGTGNEINENISNVLKLYRIVQRNASQVVFYDPGVGTLSGPDRGQNFNKTPKPFSVWRPATASTTMCLLPMNF